MEDSISSKFTKATSYTMIGSVFARLCGVCIGVVIARTLGSSLLGLYAIVQSTISLYATFFGLGLGLTATKMIAQHYIHSSKMLGRILGLLFLTIILSIVIGSSIYLWTLPIIVKKIYTIPALMELLQIGLFWFTFLTLSQFLEAVLIGFQAFRSQMLVTSILSLFNLFVVLFVVFINKNNILQNLIITGAVLAFLQSLLLLIYVSKELLKYKIIFSFNDFKSLIQPVFLNFSVPTFIGKILEQPLSWLSVLFLVKLGGDLSNVGGLNIINSIKGWILYFPSMLTVVLIPILTEIYHTREKDIFRRTLITNQRFLWLSTLPILVLLTSTIHVLIDFLFGNSYTSFWQPAALLLSWSFLIPINEVNDRAIISMGKMWLSLSFRIIYMFFSLITLVLFIPRFQLLGYIAATGISYLIYVLIQTCWLRKVTQGRISSLLLLAAFSFLILSLAYSIALFFNGYSSIVAGIILFIITIFLEWKFLISKDEKALVFRFQKAISSINKNKR